MGDVVGVLALGTEHGEQGSAGGQRRHRHGPLHEARPAREGADAGEEGRGEADGRDGEGSGVGVCKVAGSASCQRQEHGPAGAAGSSEQPEEEAGEGEVACQVLDVGVQEEGGAGPGPFVEERHPDRVEPEAGRPGRGLAGEGVEQGVQEGKGFRAPAPARKVQEKDSARVKGEAP